MSKKVVIDAYRGGDDIGNTASNLIEKDFNLEISKYIHQRLNELGIPNTMTRTEDITMDIENRTNLIKSVYGTGNDVIVISNALTSGSEGAEIVYALRNSSTLASNIAEQLEKTGTTVNKYYQRRLPSDTAKDYNQLIRDTDSNETLIIYYGNTDNEDEVDNLINNLESLGEAVVIALADYLDVAYISESEEYYVVVSGDTLYSIANKYNTTVTELKQLNNLSSNILTIGTVLKIPTQEEIETEDDYITYTVVKGDTVFMGNGEY